MPHKGAGGRDSAQKASVHPTIRDLEWAAGFIEGEGCFSTNCGRQGSEQVDVAQVQQEPLERLQRLFGGRISVMRQATKTRAAPLWHWRISGPRARGVSYTLYTLLSTRRKHQICEAQRRVRESCS